MAVPHPDEELQRLQRLCRQGLPRAVVVTGPNDFYRHEAVELLLAAVPKDAELRRIDAVDDRGGGSAEDDADERAAAGDAPAEGLQDVPELGDLRGGGLFAKSAFVCVRRGSKWWQRCATVLAAQLPHTARGCGLLLEAPKLDRRRKAAAALAKELADAGAWFEFRDLYETSFGSTSLLDGELAKWVKRRAAALGVPLSAEAAVLVVVQVGKSLAELQAELHRLRDRLGARPERQPLGPDALRGALTCSFESTPFEFAEAVLARDEVRALRSVRAMFDRGVRGKDGRRDTGGVLPFTASWTWQALAKAYEGRQLLEAGVPLRDVPARLAVGRFADRFAEQVRKNDLPALRRGLLALHHCQRLARTSGEEPDALLEQFLACWFGRTPLPGAEDLEP